MNHKIKLSICIGTFNRVEFIGETLDSIFLQNSKFIEIILVDGGSTDGTEILVNSYLKKYKNLRYIKLPFKGGFDQDYTLAVSKAKGDYCWLFSDDDIVKPGAVEYILKNLKLKFDSLIINAEIRDSTLSAILKNRCMNLNKNKVFNSDQFQQFFVATAAHSSYVGSLVIKRSVWNSRDKKKYFGTLFVHVGVLFQSPFRKKTLVIAKPLISIRYGNAMWTVRSFEISLFVWPKLIWGLKCFSNEAKNKIISNDPWKSIMRLLYYRARGSYSIDQYNKFLFKRLDIFMRLFAYLVAISPGKLLNFIFSSYFYLFRFIHKNSRLILIDLEKSDCHCGVIFSNKLI
jgi:glycosyltransferase involved in cell wall biosynthesis